MRKICHGWVSFLVSFRSHAGLVFFHALSFSLEEMGTDQTHPTFCGLQKLALEGTLYSMFPPPPKKNTIRFPPSPLAASRPYKVHREIRGRFRKRVVLANVSSFRFSFRGNMRTYPRSGFCRSGGTSERTLVPVFVPGEHPPKPPFWKPPFWVPPKSEPVQLRCSL